MARIAIVAPAAGTPHAGNRVTADRYAGHLRTLGHRVTVAETVAAAEAAGRAELLIALHARKSAAAVAKFVRRRPPQPAVVVLTGTDLYRDIFSSRAAEAAVESAARLVVFHDEGLRRLPAVWRKKATVIHKSSPPLTAAAAAPLKRSCEVSVSGHLRSVKDPVRAALAARRLPASSRIRVTQFGAPLSAAMQLRAEREMDCNGRYHYLGEVSRGRARRLLARSRVLVVSSQIEGAANVIAEAAAARVPVVASRISGNLGMLGRDYPGYFELKSTQQLAELLLRCEREPQFLRRLRKAVAGRAPLFRPSRERAELGRLVAALLGQR